MGMIINSPTAGGGNYTLDLSFITTDSSKILEGYIGSDIDGNPVEGTMMDNGMVSASLNAGNSYTIPKGYHNGYGIIYANTLASQTQAYASEYQLLSGYTAWVNGAKITGTMINQGSKTSTLNAGESYTIPAGYHNGYGEITANSLASQTSANATAAQILSGYNAWANGSKINGSIPNRGNVNQFLNAGQSYTIPLGYHGGTGKVTANSLASQTSANATAAHIRSGYNAWVNGAKINGTLAIQSALSFSAAALSPTTIRINWKNPSKGPWQGVFIQMSTSGNPGTGGGSRVYTGAGNNPNQANGNNYVDIGGLSANTQYYFTCTSYVDALGWGNSYNVSVRTPSDGVIYSYGYDPYGVTANLNPEGGFLNLGNSLQYINSASSAGQLMKDICICWSNKVFDINILKKYNALKVVYSDTSADGGYRTFPQPGIVIMTDPSKNQWGLPNICVSGGYNASSTPITVIKKPSGDQNEAITGFPSASWISSLIKANGGSNLLSVGIKCGDFRIDVDSDGTEYYDDTYVKKMKIHHIELTNL